MIESSIATAPAPRCKICSQPTAHFIRCDFHANAKLHMGYYARAINPSGVMLDYFRCTGCGFLFTPFMDDWDGSKFAQFVYNKDYPLLDGSYNGHRAGALANILYLGFHDMMGQLDFLDYGGGLGIQSALLAAFGARRSITYDPFAANAKRPEGLFNVVTSLEVLEHSVDPKKTAADLVSLFDHDNGFLFATTELLPDNIATQKDNWWYICPRVGHISFYTPQALGHLFVPHGFKILHVENHSHIIFKKWPIWAQRFFEVSELG
ncbi:MAG TPA: class I SAM-dependent methyltransferase [Alphaproteobacteria bacterium]|nr:class I SAM-dependent methyltransferase [Alphaproteobacteria bacterium]